MKTFLFVVSFSLSRVIGKHRTVKGGRGNTKEIDFQVMLISNPTPTQSFRVNPLEISYQFSPFLQCQRQRYSGL